MGNYLGALEEIVLLSIGILGEQAYGVSIQTEIDQRTGHKHSMGALHSTLSRLEGKGMIRSQMGGATAERGGRRKRFFQLTASGEAALLEAKQLRENFWSSFPGWALDT
ncbi:helix-turn-helix transcriptional regulator [Pontibacter sp. G13]|uniref:PadR family transcriptional regulator n=1 Tax=Pontibacter sp. G13 TaxID=3074898 RepID=UPI002889342A|nr:helix-turn-helix transcriptional regulator [Pontibacter sp. G13]WNJ16363.1 helix-turn-helix transcriptional regulator [Pontibacter sp. G13]